MADGYARTRYTKQQVEAIIRNGIDACNGRGPDTYGFARVFQGAVAYSLFSSIHTAFLAKSNHDQDELGFKWIDLKPKTKAYNRPDARAGLNLPGNKLRPTLNPAQDKVWRGIFARILHKLKGRGFTTKSERSKMSPKTYKRVLNERRRTSAAIGAGAAWIFVKEHMNAHTLLELTRDKKLPLLQRSKRLVESLQPAPLTSNGAYVPTNPDQVCRGAGGLVISGPISSLTIGTRVPYAEHVHKDRPLWPRNLSIWMGRAVTAGRDAVQQRLTEVLREG